MEEAESPVKPLVRLGMSRYQARVYSSLSFLGIAGASDIAKNSGVPRTKAYEVLDELAKMGAVEFQVGRPTLYRAVPPSELVKRLREGYMDSAMKVVKLMRYEKPQRAAASQADLVWTVKGWDTIRRKMSEVISSAERTILMIEGSPPQMIRLVKASLLSCKSRRVEVRAVVLVPEGEDVERELELAEYRRLRLAGDPSDDKVRQMLEFVRGMQSGSYAVAIVDDSRSFMALPDKRHPEDSLGISLKIRGLPLLQRMLIEGLLSSQTSPL